MTLEDVLTALGTVLLVPIGGWLVRLESRVSQQATRTDGMSHLIEAKFQANAETLERIEKTIDRRLERIERSLNGHLLRD